MAPLGTFISGVGGDQLPSLATVKEFTIFGAKFPNVVFYVAGNDLGPAVGALGQNLFRVADTEYDLANGAIRIMRPGKECKSIALAYWAKPGSYSEIDINVPTEDDPHVYGYAYVNGKRIKVMFDTGSARSLLSLSAAKSLGITPTSEGVEPAGTSTGVGKHHVENWIAPFHSFKIGEEEIRDTRLLIGDIGSNPAGEEMLLGGDFFLSHRVYVAISRGKLYFTYNGGPVFNLGSDSKSASARSESIAVASGQTIGGAAEPTDAAGFSRRAAVASARHDYASAIADLDRACKLAPTEPRYFRERGMALREDRQYALAAADFDAALKLKPDDVPSLLARASLRAKSDTTADLEAADRYLPKEAPEHLEIGATYERMDLLPAAVLQYSKWIDSHERSDVDMAHALNLRCWARALQGQELEGALADCNGALKAQSGSADLLDSRGLVYLRLGSYDRAMADYDAALAAEPKIAWSHYGRGIARIRTGRTSDGQADIAAAISLSPKIAETAQRHGIVP